MTYVYVLQFCIITVCSMSDLLAVTLDTGTESIEVNVDHNVIFQLLRRMEHLESRDKARESEIRLLRAQLHTQKKRTVTLEAKLQRLVSNTVLNETKDRKNKEEQTKQENNEVMNSKDVTEMKGKDSIKTAAGIQDLGDPDKRGAVNTHRIKRTEGNEMTVGFFAALTNHLTHHGSNQYVAFDHVITNIGNAYNPHLGGFIAPTAGLYVFSVTLQSINGSSHYALCLNGHAVSFISIIKFENNYPSSSQTVVLQLKPFDDVAVMNLDENNGIHGHHYSTFTGFLLQQDNTSATSIVGK